MRSSACFIFLLSFGFLLCGGVYSAPVSRFQVSIPTPARAVKLSWDYPIRFEVWGSSNLASWFLVTNTAERSLVLPASERLMFFRVRAVDTNGLTSAWNVK